MKLILFTFVVLLGIFLIHADEETKKENVGPSPNAPLIPKVDSPATSEKEKPQTVSTPASDTKPAHPDPKTASEHPENEPAKSGSESTSTTSTLAPAHTPEPTPYPAGHGTWNVTDPKTNVTCIIVAGTISLDVSLKNYENVTESWKIDLGPKTPAHGNCAEKKIRWDLDTRNSTLQFEFFVNETAKDYYLSRVDGEVYVPQLNKTKHPFVGFNKTDMHAFVTPLNKSYACNKELNQPIVNGKVVTVSVTLKDFHYQAAKFTKANTLDESIDGCPTPSGGGPDVIPIVVGCALAILVVIVLVAYLINRRRSQAHGYLSM